MDRSVPERIHIFGASGTGTTSLASLIAQKYGHRHLDTDDFYWLPTDPPFETKRAPEERLELLGVAMEESPRWVLSGSVCRWGDPLLSQFELVVFMHLDPATRLARLMARERQRYGDAAITPGGPLYDHHRAFMDWAAAYDTGGMEIRSLALHEAWLKRIECPSVRLDANRPLGVILTELEDRIGGLSKDR